MQSTDNDLLTKLFLCRYYDRKIQDLYAPKNLTKFHNVCHIKRCVTAKFNKYCDDLFNLYYFIIIVCLFHFNLYDPSGE